MIRLCRYALLMIVLASLPVRADAQAEAGRGAALDHLGRGTAAFRTGDMAAAVREWSEAIRLARAVPAPDLEAQALARRGEAYRTQGYLRDADVDLRAALAMAEASGNRSLVAGASGALGNLELAARHPELAEPLLQRSRDLARQLGDRNTLAASANDLGNLYAQAGRVAEAASAYEEAIASAAASGDEAFAAAAEVNAGRLAAQRNDLARARNLLARAVDRLQRAPPSYSGAMALLSAGSAASEGKGAIAPEDRQIAERAFAAATAAADSLHNPTLSSLARGGLGKLYERTGRAQAASRLTDEALFAAQKAPAPELSFRWDWQQARLDRQQGHWDTALASYRRAVAELQSVRQDIPVEYRDGNSSYRTTFGPLYLEFADLLLRRSAAESGQAAPLIREARDTIETLKESELQDYFRDSCITSFEARRQSIATVAPGTAVLYPISLSDRLELLVSFGQEQRQFTIPVAEPVLRAEVQRFRETLEKRTTNEYLVPARQLYDQIIRPLDPLLAERHIDTLVIVPDSVLRVIPFGALHDGRHFLIERYATAIAPSMHLIDPKPLGAEPRVALVLGISQSVQGFGDLPNVLHEANAVHELEGGKELVNSSFTQTSFARELKSVPYNVVHIASHGHFGADPKHTFMLAYDGQLNMDELETDIKYSTHRDKALELLVLSACETATGDDRAALGLAGVALKAGARSALASLWYVSDQAAGELVVDFYRALQSPGVSKAHALQSAQRKLAADQRYAHPAYWAPFLLIGNWL
jgi:CHAT domain-containing protein